MILRKPYAFLIKYFKWIHIAMFIIFGVLVFALRNIYNFCINLVKTSSYYFTEGLAGSYVPLYLFLLLFILIIVNIFIYSLMKKKNKPVLFYEILIGYCFILFVVLLYFRIFFLSLDGSSIEPLRMVINRDIMAFLYFGNFFFVAFNFVRGFGFDIKKFSFDQDKKELDIEDTDNEEFEFNVNIDKDKIVSKIRKEKREFGYYVKENIIVVGIILGIIVIFGGIKIYNDIIVPSKYYKENELISISNVSYKIKKSYLTPYNKYSIIASKGSNYVVVDLTINNNADIDGRLGDNRFRLNIGDEYYYLVPNMYSSFNDIGVGYRNDILKSKSSNDYILLFQIPDTVKGKMYLEIVKNSQNYTYERVLLNPVDASKETLNYNQGEEFTIDDITLVFNGYELSKSSFYEYEECQGEGEKRTCNTFTKNVAPKLNQIVLVLDIDHASQFSKDFYDNYLWIKNGDKEYTSKNLSVLELQNNQLFISVPKTFSDNAFTVIIKKRNVDYHISVGS